MMGFLLFRQRFLRELAVHLPDRSPNAGKVRPNPIDPKLHAAFRTFDLLLTGLRLEPAHAAGIMAAKLAVCPGLAETFSSGLTLFFDGHEWFLSMNKRRIAMVLYNERMDMATLTDHVALSSKNCSIWL
jgi:hypothetical protein